MTNIERDPIVRRAIDELRKLPSADAAAVRRVVAAAAAARVAPAVEDEFPPPRRFAGSGYFIAVGAAAAVLILSVLLLRPKNSEHPMVASAATANVRAAGPIQPAANGAATDALPVAQQFVFNSRTAHSVSVVGDFNGWLPDRARMTPAGDGNLWSITVPVTPGRHMYGFMVDDSIFTLDPRAQTVRDPDLGVNASVVIVGKP